MAYFEYECNQCGVYFEYIINKKERRKVFCLECHSKDLRIVGYSTTVPTRIESLQNNLTKLENRINNLLIKMGEDPLEFDKPPKEDFTFKN